MTFWLGKQKLVKITNSKYNFMQYIFFEKGIQLQKLGNFREFSSRNIPKQAGRRLVRSLLTLRVFVVDVMDLRTGNRNEDDS